MDNYEYDNNAHLYKYEYEWFPEHVFDAKQSRQGAVLLYFIGVIYLSIASIVLSYNFFVPAVLILGTKVRKLIHNASNI